MNRLVISLCALLLIGSAAADDPCSEMLCADTSFGNNGRVAVAFDCGQDDHDRANAVVRVPGEDRLYVIGQVSRGNAGDSDFGVACLLPDGSLCPDFGIDGLATVAMDYGGGDLDAAVAGAILPWGGGRDWRLVVVGQVESEAAGDTDFGVAVLRPDGCLESDASGGKTIVAFDGGSDDTDLPAAVVVDAQGRILIGGTVDAGAGDSDWGFARLNADLTRDTSFGTNGKAVLNVEGLAVLHAMLIQPDGKIVAAGSRDSGDDQMAIARINADGSPDITFGLFGQTVFDFDVGGANDDSARAMATDAQGRIVVVGQAERAGGLCWAAARVMTEGQPDPSFYFGASSFFDCLDNPTYAARATTILPDGLNVTVFETDERGDHDYAVGAWRSDATTFRMEAFRVHPFDLGGSYDDRPRGLLVQPDGMIVIAGRVVGPLGNLDFGVLRLWSHQIFADGFEGWGSAAEWSFWGGPP